MTGHSTDIAPDTHPRIPHGIRWSAATAAFQVEGARDQGGRGRTIWDDFVDTPGAVVDNETADPGPDSYHRFPEDVALASGLGLDRYRFGISWARIVPDGSGPINRQGLDYYSRLVDALIEASVTPFPTLYHWDLPSPLEAAGGWLNRDTAFRLEEYATVVADCLGDRVKHWYTINEPAMTALEGYAIGTLAPAGKSCLVRSPPPTTSSSPTDSRCGCCARAAPSRSASPTITPWCSPDQRPSRTSPPRAPTT